MSHTNILQDIKSLPQGDQLQALKAAQTHLFKKSLFATAKWLLGYSEITQRTHGEMIRVLEGPQKRKLIVMPRGTFKTSIAVVAYPIWRLINDPNLRIMVDSELYGNAKRSVREISQHLQSPKLTEMFGVFRDDRLWNESELLIKQRTVIKKEASIMASGIGAEKTGVHADLILADDLCSPSNMNTQENREKVLSHYRYYTSILEPGGTIVVVGTRYHSSDLYASILQNEIFLPEDLGDASVSQ